jgi:hypothetical protein
LQQQFSLIAAMKTKAKTIVDTSWESMYTESNLFKVHRVQLLQYFEEKIPNSKAPMKWWLVFLFIADISAYATVTFCSLEGLTALIIIFAQHQGLLGLQFNYMHLFQVVGPMEGNDNVNENLCALSDDRKFSASFVSIAIVFEDIGIFAVETLDALDVVEKYQPYQNVSKCVVNLIAGIARVVAEQDSMNEAANEILSILPHMLLKLCGKDFAEVLQKQKECLLKRWTVVEIDAIEWEFQELKLAYQNEGPLKDALDNCDYKTSFQTGWNYLQNQFNSLKLFCEGMATAFPGT